jgi:outer membrane receptor protein involved in Fe transport
VINLITQAPRPTGETSVRGTAGYQYGGAGNQRRLNGRVTATMGSFAFSASGATRDASNYRAPSGSFGDLTLANAVELQDSGVRDESVQLYAGWRGTAGHGAWLRQELYGARDAGFGFVEPRVLGDTSTKIALTYPWQSVRKTTAGFNSGALNLPFMDKLDVSGYTQRNARDFNSAVDVFIPTGPGRTATIVSRSFNYTDVRTQGFRAEASKVLAPVTVTYGADFVYDDARNRDSSWSRTTGFGPFPVVSSNTTSTTPNSAMRNLGLFAQGDWRVLDRLSVITGVRYHDVHAETKASTASSAVAQEASNRTSVYAVNALYRLTDQVRLVASHGRGFRAPNLIERYFSGPSTDGTAIQIANPALRPEQSRNVDVGVRYTAARVSAELFAFQSTIADGIIVRPTGRTFGRQAEFQNINVEELETTGYEASLGVDVGRGVSVTGNYTKIDTKNPATPDVPVAGTYNSRLNVALGYRPASGRFWTEYVVRHHGQQQDINLGTSPVGAVVPAFTVMHWRGGVRVASFGGRAQELTVALNNVGNALYAEAANTAFFRPEPARHLVVGVRAAF